MLNGHPIFDKLPRWDVVHVHACVEGRRQPEIGVGENPRVPGGVPIVFRRPVEEQA